MNLAIVGATGLVGQTFIKVFEERKLPVTSLTLFASERSAGTSLPFQGKMIPVTTLSASSFEQQFDVVLFSAGASVSKEFAPIAVASGAYVVDNSSYWRMHEGIPLVVPEINASDIPRIPGIIANPNCSTIQSVMALFAIHQQFGITRLSYTTYQAVSGAGQKAVNDYHATKQGQEPTYFKVPIDKVVYPQIDVFLDDYSTKEEQKMMDETKKILHDSSIKISSTCVRVGVENGHSVAIQLQTKKPFTLSEVESLLQASSGIMFYPHPTFPTALDADGNDTVHVGRVRLDKAVENGLHLWVVADNIRKGAATNAVQIVESILGGNHGTI
jgi:aspartate-semialdehyde dehydrogenase